MVKIFRFKRRRSSFFAFSNYRFAKFAVPITLILVFAMGAVFIERLSGIAEPKSLGVISGPIAVTDGDTVRSGGYVYRLVGFDTPENGNLARCQFERTKATAATIRLQQLINSGSAHLERVACACQAGTEDTAACNYGRRCAVLTVGGRDVGPILIGEGLAHPYTCSTTHCPRRQSWCNQQ